VPPRRSLTLVTGPAKEPLSLAEVKAWAKIDASDEDALLVSVIAAARASAEQYLGRSLITQTWKLTLDLAQNGLARGLGEGVYDLPISALYGDFPRTFYLPKGPVQSVTSVTTYDTSNTGTVFDASNYFVDTAGDRIVLNDSASWPSSLRAVAACEIVYVAGYGDEASSVPQPIRTALLQHAQKMYDDRIQCDLPDACERMLRQYRQIGERYA
jgi:hypothetical protein